MSLLKSLFGRSRPAEPEKGALYHAVRAAMADVQAYARSHGGEIELIGVTDDGEVTIRLAGACRGCPVSGFTLKYGIEEQLRRLVPDVKKIKQI